MLLVLPRRDVIGPGMAGRSRTAPTHCRLYTGCLSPANSLSHWLPAPRGFLHLSASCSRSGWAGMDTPSPGLICQAEHILPCKCNGADRGMSEVEEIQGAGSAELGPMEMPAALSLALLIFWAGSTLAAETMVMGGWEAAGRHGSPFALPFRAHACWVGLAW